jgi:hypothetical protein
MLVGRKNYCIETKMHYSKNKYIGGLLLIDYKPIPTIECSVSEYFFDGFVELVQFVRLRTFF